MNKISHRLKWTSNDFNNLTEIVMQANQLWIPDFNIINIADGSAGFISISSYNHVIVNNEGLVFMIFGLSGLKTKCALSAYYYPYDRYAYNLD